MTETVHQRVHKSRAQEARRPAVREELDAPWEEPRNLPEIPARPGFVQRWVRVSLQGGPDPSNIGYTTREGWKPRDPATVPDHITPPKLSQGAYAGCIGIQDVILCEMPLERVEARRRHYDRKTQQQNDAVRRDLFNEQRPGVRYEWDQTSKVERGRIPRVAGDERPSAPADSSDFADSDTHED